jgi:hypothetical protein
MWERLGGADRLLIKGVSPDKGMTGGKMGCLTLSPNLLGFGEGGVGLISRHHL